MLYLLPVVLVQITAVRMVVNIIRPCQDNIKPVRLRLVFYIFVVKLIFVSKFPGCIFWLDGCWEFVASNEFWCELIVNHSFMLVIVTVVTCLTKLVWWSNVAGFIRSSRVTFSIWQVNQVWQWGIGLATNRSQVWVPATLLQEQLGASCSHTWASVHHAV